MKVQQAAAARKIQSELSDGTPAAGLEEIWKSKMFCPINGFHTCFLSLIIVFSLSIKDWD